MNHAAVVVHHNHERDGDAAQYVQRQESLNRRGSQSGLVILFLFSVKDEFRVVFTLCTQGWLRQAPLSVMIGGCDGAPALLWDRRYMRPRKRLAIISKPERPHRMDQVVVTTLTPDVPRLAFRLPVRGSVPALAMMYEW